MDKENNKKKHLKALEIPSKIVKQDVIEDVKENHGNSVNSESESESVENINDINQFVEGLKAIPTDQIYRLKRRRSHENSAYSIAINDLRREQNIQKYVERGRLEDLELIKIELNDDPYKLLRNASHPHALINKRNSNGQTPLYVACKNGNLEVVKLLLGENADYLLTSLVDSEEETNLEVAARWRHKKVIEELLKKKWPKKVLEKAKALCRAPDIIELFGNKTKAKKGCFCCFSKH